MRPKFAIMLDLDLKYSCHQVIRIKTVLKGLPDFFEYE